MAEVKNKKLLSETINNITVSESELRREKLKIGEIVRSCGCTYNELQKSSNISKNNIEEWEIGIF